jgi:transposase
MQVKVLGAERRRRWSYDEKVRLVEETLQAGETVCGVARRHGLAQSLLFNWRRQARQGRLGREAVPVEITATPALASMCAPQPLSSLPARRTRSGIIEIELGGTSGGGALATFGSSTILRKEPSPGSGKLTISARSRPAKYACWLYVSLRKTK